jgi:GMP synthase (glutamine-hydrolysing)
LRALAPRAVILSGGPASVPEPGSPRPPAEVFQLGMPVLGICYGQQAMVDMLGGRVEGGHAAEFGHAWLEPAGRHGDDPIFSGLFEAGREAVWMSHGDRVTAMPDGFEVFGTSPGAPFAMIGDARRHFYAVMFHPEVHHTPNGRVLLANFSRMAGFSGHWTMGAYRAEAIGDRLTCVFVDHGLLRQNEAQEVVGLFRDHYNIPLIHADEGTRFVGALAGIADPEIKRKTIGKLFIEVFEDQAKRLGGARFLAQGTLYPDVIESVSASGGPSVTIKSHHNVGGLPERMNMALVEPLRALFKDEVRALGRELGLPEHFVGRHPFPGPGLAIRCPGAVTPERLAILRAADAVFIDQIRRHGLYDDIWQAFVALLPVKSVGVMGDGRSYDYACALRAVTSVDGMTADVYPFTHDFLRETANRIVGEVRGINRVTWDITSKPPGTIEWE